eukprot:Skav229937  [mRNA]  locus=scaffold7556:33379:37301:+ [translate_table: standard]
MISEPSEEFPLLAVQSSTFSFWRNAIEGDDQLRQRMAFALSQILVVSNFGGEILTDIPEPVVGYQDILVEGAFGNYRDLLEEVTYSPAMGYYLTYMGNQKGDPATGRMPDENYAREILQLFTIGVVRLGPDGEPVVVDGRPVELYDNMDVTDFAAQNGGVYGSVGDQSETSSQVQGAMPLSGAIFDVATVDLRSGLLYAAHEELDPIVPCGTDEERSSLTGLVVSGACDVVPAYENAGQRAELFLVRNAVRHVEFTEDQRREIYQGAAELFFDAGVNKSVPKIQANAACNAE